MYFNGNNGAASTLNSKLYALLSFILNWRHSKMQILYEDAKNLWFTIMPPCSRWKSSKGGSRKFRTYSIWNNSVYTRTMNFRTNWYFNLFQKSRIKQSHSHFCILLYLWIFIHTQMQETSSCNNLQQFGDNRILISTLCVCKCTDLIFSTHASLQHSILR